MHDLLKMFAPFAPRVVPIHFEHDEKSLDIFVKQLTARQVFAMQAKQKDKEKGIDNQSFALFLLTECVCDENGNQVLTKEDAQQMLDTQVKAFNALVAEVAKGSGLSNTTVEKPGNA